MDIDSQPWHIQVQIRQLQALLADYRSGKLKPKTKQERNILRLIETITLAVLISDDAGGGG